MEGGRQVEHCAPTITTRGTKGVAPSPWRCPSRGPHHLVLHPLLLCPSRASSGDIVLFDTATGKDVTVLHALPTPLFPSSPSAAAATPAAGSSLYCMALHPTLPLAITGHADRTMRFYDLGSGRHAPSPFPSLAMCRSDYHSGWPMV